MYIIEYLYITCEDHPERGCGWCGLVCVRSIKALVAIGCYSGWSPVQSGTLALVR